MDDEPWFGRHLGSTAITCGFGDKVSQVFREASRHFDHSVELSRTHPRFCGVAIHNAQLNFAEVVVVEDATDKLITDLQFSVPDRGSDGRAGILVDNGNRHVAHIAGGICGALEVHVPDEREQRSDGENCRCGVLEELKHYPGQRRGSMLAFMSVIHD